jgi:integrase
MKLSISYSLKSGGNSKTPIQAFLSYGNKQFDVATQKMVYKPLKYYTGLTIYPSEWDNVNKKPYSITTSKKLEDIGKTIERLFNLHYSIHRTIKPEILKEELDEVIKGKTRKADIVQRIRIVSFIKTEILHEIADKSEQNETKQKGSYDDLVVYIEAFEKQSGKELYIHELNESVFLQFMEIVRARNNRYNSVTNIYNTFKATLNKIARKYKVSVFNPTQELGDDDKQTFVNTSQVFLDFEKIQKVVDYQPKTKPEAEVKLIFLTLLFTGCRYSDVFKIKPEFIYMKGNIHFKYARYISQKTNIEVAVPMLKPLADAINSNGGQTAEVRDRSDFNKRVKDLCRDCGLTELTMLSFTDSYGVKQFVEKPFYKFVSSHTGRRSLVTNLLNHVPETVLSKITGHEIGQSAKSKNTIQGYNHITPEESAAMFYRMLMKLQIIDEEHFIFPLAA